MSHQPDWVCAAQLGCSMGGALGRSGPHSSAPSHVQPHAKRARCEPRLEEEYRSALRAAAGALEAIGSLLRGSPAPDWLPREMCLLQEKVGQLQRDGLSGDL